MKLLVTLIALSQGQRGGRGRDKEREVPGRYIL